MKKIKIKINKEIIKNKAKKYIDYFMKNTRKLVYEAFIVYFVVCVFYSFYIIDYKRILFQ